MMKYPETHWEDPQFVIRPAEGQFMHHGPFQYIVVDTLDGAVVQLVESEAQARQWITEMERSIHGCVLH